ncbi:MAG TPA: HNH endonuclease signature motif containing protein [Solirubrobacteraceae bacterium]
MAEISLMPWMWPPTAGPVCAVDGCGDFVWRERWCNKHYLRWKRTGDPLGSTAPTPAQRFWRKVDKTAPNGCWLWTGAARHKAGGYGTFNHGHGRGWIPAHRFALELAYGPIDDGLEVHHRCRTPACVNPEHLMAVTRSAHGREHRATHCHRGHDLSEHGYYRKDRTKTLAYCRACQRVRKAA